MSSYAEMVQRQRQARALYLKLRALGLDARAERCADGAVGRRVVVEGLRSLNPDHADRLMRLVRDNEAGLLKIISDERGPDAMATRREESNV